jgi:hypothetical protein
VLLRAGHSATMLGSDLRQVNERDQLGRYNLNSKLRQHEVNTLRSINSFSATFVKSTPTKLHAAAMSPWPKSYKTYFESFSTTAYRMIGWLPASPATYSKRSRCFGVAYGRLLDLQQRRLIGPILCERLHRRDFNRPRYFRWQVRRERTAARAWPQREMMRNEMMKKDAR